MFITSQSYSNNLYSWTQLTSSNQNCIVNNGSMWIGGSSTPNTLSYSSNGTTWTGLGATVFTTQCNAVDWSGTQWVAGGQGTNTLAYSTNGTSWTGISLTAGSIGTLRYIRQNVQG